MQWATSCREHWWFESLLSFRTFFPGLSVPTSVRHAKNCISSLWASYMFYPVSTSLSLYPPETWDPQLRNEEVQCLLHIKSSGSKVTSSGRAGGGKSSSLFSGFFCSWQERWDWVRHYPVCYWSQLFPHFLSQDFAGTYWSLWSPWLWLYFRLKGVMYSGVHMVLYLFQ